MQKNKGHLRLGHLDLFVKILFPVGSETGIFQPRATENLGSGSLCDDVIPQRRSAGFL